MGRQVCSSFNILYIKTGYDTPEFYKEILKQFKNYKEKEEREEK